MIIFRCLSKAYLSDPLSGEGAKKYGGRFNSVGVPAVYASEHRAMAILETALRQPINKISSDFIILPIQVPDSYIDISLSKDWLKNKTVTQKKGDYLLENQDTLLIRVPSSLINKSYNYLINAKAHNIANVKVLAHEPILLDQRLIQLFR